MLAIPYSNVSEELKPLKTKSTADADPMKSMSSRIRGCIFIL